MTYFTCMGAACETVIFVMDEMTRPRLRHVILVWAYDVYIVFWANCGTSRMRPECEKNTYPITSPAIIA